MVLVGNNKMLPSNDVETFRVISMVDRAKHNIALEGVIYTPRIMYNLISIAQVGKNEFPVLIDDNLNNARLERTDLE